MSVLSWPEIRNRATAFARDWRHETSERAEAQTFWNEFFEVFGVNRKRTGIRFEKAVERFGKRGRGRIDVFWPGTLLTEHKSADQDLDAAHTQATGYFDGLSDNELPRYVIVSDFQRFRLYDLEDNDLTEFKLSELPVRISLFGFIAGYSKIKVRDEDPLNIKAVQLLGELHDALKQDGDDTGGLIARLFQTLNVPRERRQRSLEEEFGPFPYINGRLFEEALPIPEFSSKMRELLLDCCRVQWANISPAIFGAMFQKVIELGAKDRRRQLGAHYTSEANIRKVISPLFMDELRAEFEKVKNHKNKLFAFHDKLRRLCFLDPACGCGNFLVITYRELRKLELDVLRGAAKFGTATGRVFEALQINVDQFYGIEIEEFPAQVAQVAMWLTDHQMNVEAGREFGEFFARIPLEKSATIRHGNALRLEWEALVPPDRLNYILGNPPFVGKHYRTRAQREDLETVAKGMKAVGDLDYVAGWFLKAAQYLSGSKEGFVSRDKKQFQDTRFGKQALGIEDIFVELERADEEARKHIRGGFVSTKSITQGEQVSVLWSELLRRGVKIHFAHRTFKWSNDAPGKAAVHCVIIGFGRNEADHKRLFDYADVKGVPHEHQVSNISPYLTDGPDLIVAKRTKPLMPVPQMRCGNKPTDGGNLLLTPAERAELLAQEPEAATFVKRYVGSEEFINGIERYCLWLVDATPAQLHAMPLVKKRVEAVRRFREASSAAPTKRAASTPTRFFYQSQPDSDYILVPEVSSERRHYVPVGWMTKDIITSNKNYIIAQPHLFLFGVLQSAMHMAWMRLCAGRLKSDYQYSGTMVYNTFPWPQKLEDTHRDAIETAAQGVLGARTAHPGAILAQLYDPNTMPPNLSKAHARLDRAVDAAYVPDGGQKTFAGDAERIAFLFRRYAALTSLLV